MKFHKKKNNSFLGILVIILVLPIAVIFLQSKSALRTQASVTSYQVKCAPQGTVQYTFSYVNNEGYAGTLVVDPGPTGGGGNKQIPGVLPGETRSGVLDTGVSSVPAGFLTFVLTPTSGMNSAPIKPDRKSYAALTCQPSTIAEPTFECLGTSCVPSTQPSPTPLPAVMSPIPTQIPAEPQPTTVTIDTFPSIVPISSASANPAAMGSGGLLQMIILFMAFVLSVLANIL